MSEITTPNIDTEVSKVTTETINTPEFKVINNNSGVEISKLSKDYKFWARFNQVMIIIGGVFSLPVGALAIVGAVKFNKSIEIVDETSKDAKTQEFIESVKDLQKWSVINIFGACIFGIFIGIAFGALIFGLIMTGVNSSTKNQMVYPSSSDNYNPYNPEIGSKPEATKYDSESTSKPFNISTDEGSMTMDAEGNMKITDKDGKVTTVNMDGTMGN